MPRGGCDEVGDFRIGQAGKPRDWVLKLYGHKNQRKQIRIETMQDEQFAIIYQNKPVRSVALARVERPPRNATPRSAVHTGN